MLGVAAGDHAVDNGDEVPGKKRHTLGWFSGQKCSECIDIGRVNAINPEVLQGDRELLVRDTSVRPSVSGKVEGGDDIGLGDGWRRPVKGRQCAVVPTVTYQRGTHRMPVAHHD